MRNGNFTRRVLNIKFKTEMKQVVKGIGDNHGKYDEKIHWRKQL